LLASIQPLIQFDMGFFGDLFGHDDAQKQNEYIYETEFVPEKHKASFTHEGALLLLSHRELSIN
jgi:hypothetical protein